jgi:hypothetical protein
MKEVINKGIRINIEIFLLNPAPKEEIDLPLPLEGE